MDESSHRNMSDGQKCWAGAQFHDDLLKTKNGGKFATANGKSRDVVALRFGVSPRQLQDARLLMAKSPALFARLGDDRTYNVNRAMQEWKRGHRQREIRRHIDKTPVDLKGCRLMLGDVVEQLELLPAKSARVVFADPPYNIGKKYHADKTGDLMEDEKFLVWCSRWLAECKRILTPDGSLFVMINGQYAARLEMILRQLEMHRRNTIYWWENNPENQKGNFSDAVRQIHYFVKHEDMYLFHDEVRVPSRRNEIADKRGLEEGKIPDNVWIDARIPGNCIDRVPYDDAPPQLPITIPETCVRIASDPGDTIVDPFNGNGTTGIAALAWSRKYIGVDQSKKYLEQSKKWIAVQAPLLAKQRRADEDGKERG